MVLGTGPGTEGVESLLLYNTDEFKESHEDELLWGVPRGVSGMGSHERVSSSSAFGDGGPEKAI